MLEKTGNTTIARKALPFLHWKAELKRNALAGGAVLMSVFYIFAQYALPVMSYGFAALCLYAALHTLIRQRLAVNKSLLYFIGFALIHQLFVYLATGTFSKNRNTYLFQIVCLVLLSAISQIDKEKFYACYKAVGIFVSIILIFQAMPLYASALGIGPAGVRVSPIRILPVAPENLHFWFINGDRPSSMFTEPQAFSSYIHPLLIMSLYREKKIFPTFLTVAVFLSGSSQGILVALFIWAYYLFFVEKNANTRIIVLFLGTCGIVLGIQFGILSAALEKILSITVNMKRLGGYNARLTKGFLFYALMSRKEQLIGLGNGNLDSFLRHGGIVLPFWMDGMKEEIYSYVTTVSNVLISFGAMGGLMYASIFARELRRTRSEARLLLLVILMISFTQTILFNAWFVLYWSVYQIIDHQDANGYFRMRCKILG